MGGNTSLGDQPTLGDIAGDGTADLVVARGHRYVVLADFVERPPNGLKTVRYGKRRSDTVVETAPTTVASAASMVASFDNL